MPANSVAVAVANSLVTTLMTESTCTLIRSLEIYDQITQSWVQYTSALSTSYPWITLWTDPVGPGPVPTSSTNGFSIYTEDFDLFDNELNPPSTWQLRMRVQDYYSTSSSAVIFDNFSVTIKFECDDDFVTLSSDITMFVYSTNPGTPQNVNANWQQAISNCQMLFKAEVYDGFLTGVSGLNQISTATTSSWIEIAPSGGTGSLAWVTGFNEGTLTIDTSTAYDPYKDFAVRITYTSKYSQYTEADRTKVEYYIVRLTPSSICIWNELTKTAEMSNWKYIVSNSGTIENHDPSFTQTVVNCKIYQKLYFLDETTQAWIDWNANQADYPFASFADGLNTLS